MLLPIPLFNAEFEIFSDLSDSVEGILMRNSTENRKSRAFPSLRLTAPQFKMPIPVIGVLLLFPYTETALADCTPASPASGDTVICNGNPNGFSTSGLGSLDVVIQQNTNLVRSRPAAWVR
jgi:hypothetical protein